jgi:pyruvate carboxylase
MNRMENALKGYHIEGISTNIPMHLVIIKNKYFRDGEYTTHFIPEHDIINEVQKLLTK